MIVLSAGSFLLCLVATLYFDQRPNYVSIYLALGVVLSYILLVIYDTTFVDPTSHNLAGLVVTILVVLSLPAALIGGYLGVLLRKFVKGPAPKS